jgi:hypothetical protein
MELTELKDWIITIFIKMSYNQCTNAYFNKLDLLFWRYGFIRWFVQHFEAFPSAPETAAFLGTQNIIPYYTASEPTI